MDNKEYAIKFYKPIYINQNKVDGKTYCFGNELNFLNYIEYRISMGESSIYDFKYINRYKDSLSILENNAVMHVLVLEFARNGTLWKMKLNR